MNNVGGQNKAARSSVRSFRGDRSVGRELDRPGRPLRDEAATSRHAMRRTRAAQRARVVRLPNRKVAIGGVEIIKVQRKRRA